MIKKKKNTDSNAKPPSTLMDRLFSFFSTKKKKEPEAIKDFFKTERDDFFPPQVILIRDLKGSSRRSTQTEKRREREPFDREKGKPVKRTKARPKRGEEPDPKKNETHKAKKGGSIKTRVDKKGIPFLTDKHDLNEVFTDKQDKKGPVKSQVEKKQKMERKRKEDAENFDRLFKESLVDPRQKKLLVEKISMSNPHLSPNIRYWVKNFPPPQEEIDLHGFTAVEAEKRAEGFLWNAQRNGIKTVRLIVGKGLHSEGKAVLRDVIERKLIELKEKKCILAFRWENKEKNKSGALIVYLSPVSIQSF